MDIRLEDKGDLFSVKRELHECASQCQLLYGDNDVLTRTVMYRQAWVEEDDRNYGNAERIYREIVRRSEVDLVSKCLPDRIGIRVRVRLAAMLSKLGNEECAESLLREASDACIKHFGLDDYETCVVLSALADSLKRQTAIARLRALESVHAWFFKDSD